MPFAREAANLSRMRSPAISLSNWAKESNTLRVSRPMLLEQLDQLGKVGERTGEAVDLVDHHDIDLAGLDIRQQRLQGRALQCSARETSVIIVGLYELPAFVSLTLYICLCGLALGIE